MNFLQKEYHHIFWNTLSVSEIGASNTFPKEKLQINTGNEGKDICYEEIKTQFFEYGEHSSKYIWGDGISCLWEDNQLRTCYFPWDNKCNAWNSARLERRASIRKLIIHSNANQDRNLGLKIQASVNNTDWTLLYSLNHYDVIKLSKEPLVLYFSDETEYSYIRILKENTLTGYDIKSIEVYTSNNPAPIAFRQNTLFYILKGALTINGVRYKAPIGILKLHTLKHDQAIKISACKNLEMLWISFHGDAALKCLDEANFDLNNTVFENKRSAYIHFLNTLLMEVAVNDKEENQFELLSKFWNLMALHMEQTDISSNPHSVQTDYVIKALQFIEEHKYEAISLTDIAKDCQVSEKYLIRIFKEQTGSSPIQYLNNWKLEKAKKLLRTTQTPIAEIAEILCFNSSTQFCKFFKQNEQISPLQYRKKHQNKIT